MPAASTTAAIATGTVRAIPSRLPLVCSNVRRACEPAGGNFCVRGLLLVHNGMIVPPLGYPTHSRRQRRVGPADRRIDTVRGWSGGFLRAGGRLRRERLGS